VAQADIAEVAVAVLSGDGAYDGQILNLTGPAALASSAPVWPCIEITRPEILRRPGCTGL
jgi:hypothetical protein